MKFGKKTVLNNKLTPSFGKSKQESTIDKHELSSESLIDFDKDVSLSKTKPKSKNKNKSKGMSSKMIMKLVTGNSNGDSMFRKISKNVSMKKMALTSSKGDDETRNMEQELDIRSSMSDNRDAPESTEDSDRVDLIDSSVDIQADDSYEGREPMIPFSDGDIGSKQSSIDKNKLLPKDLPPGNTVKANPQSIDGDTDSKNQYDSLGNSCDNKHTNEPSNLVIVEDRISGKSENTETENNDGVYLDDNDNKMEGNECAGCIIL